MPGDTPHAPPNCMCKSDAVTPSQVDLAWAAGLMDGEGTITIHPGRGATRNLPRLIATLSMTNITPLHRLRELFGGSITEKKPTSSGKPYFRWDIADRKADRVVRAVYPYLRCPDKIFQAELAIEFQAQKWPGPGIIHYRGTLALARYKVVQWVYHQGMKQLHRSLAFNNLIASCFNGMAREERRTNAYAIISATQTDD